jgi:pimeloyl-ACP methyl ester carboxylesterase
MLRSRRTLFAILFTLPIVCYAGTGEWHDPSRHKVAFVEVSPGMKLETLDWGGHGRTVLLLAGGGNTAHVFDDFAQKLTSHYRVIGLTRRGSPPSSIPDDGYSADELGDDVVAVITFLKLSKPVLIGHSFAGQEMSNVASRFPERISGLVYLDANHSWDPEFEAQGFYKIVAWKDDLDDFRNKFDKLIAEPFDSRPLAQEMLQKNLPEMRAILQKLIRIENGRPPRPDPTPDDLQSFGSMQKWYARGAKVVLPEAEFRMMHATDEKGRPTMKFIRPPFVGQKIEAGKKKYTNLHVPALGIFAAIDDVGAADMNDPEQRANAEAYIWFQRERAARKIALFQRDLPGARVVQIDRADHYVYLSNQGQVLAEINGFISTLH